MKRKLLFLIAFLGLLTRAFAQNNQQDPVLYIEGSEAIDFINPESTNGLTTSTTDILIETCGHFKLYYVNDGTGFTDPIDGIDYRSKVCEAIQYIESVIQFNCPLGSIELNMFSENNAALGWVAQAGSIAEAGYNTNKAGFYGGVMRTHIKDNIDLDPSREDGSLFVNFYYFSPFFKCKINFKHLIIHEITHALGFISAVHVNAATNKLENKKGASWQAFSIIDQLYLYQLTGSSYSKVVNNTTHTVDPNMDGNTILNKIWLTSAADNTNQPVVSYSPYTDGTTFSHLDRTFDVTRCHKAPGFSPLYVMQPTVTYGDEVIKYSEQELRILKSLGYTILAPFAAKLTNHPPYLFNGTSGGVITNADVHNYDETDIGINPNLSLGTITSCNSVVINLGNRNELRDADGDPIKIYPGSLFNIRGCGNGGNNHAQLTISQDGRGNDVIKFTPRSNFIGRAQFGFHLYDGKERGSYVVYTVKVIKNTSCFTATNELIVNGSIEEGSELYTADYTGTEKNLIDYWLSPIEFVEENYQMSHSDGMYLNYTSTDVMVKNSIACKYGVFYYNPGTIQAPDASKRFLRGAYSEDIIMDLTDNMTPCQQYQLKFDLFGLDANVKDVRIAFGRTPLECHDNLHLGINVYNFTIDDPENYSNQWKNYNKMFSYCGASNNRYMGLIVDQYNGNWHFVDNISLQKTTNPPPPLTVSTNPSPLTVCPGRSITIHTDVQNASCGLTYRWSTGATTSSITVTPLTTRTYSVTVNDGCRTASTSAVVSIGNPSTINVETTTETSCAGSQVTLTATNGFGQYTWSDGTTTTTISINNTLVVNPLVTTTYSVTATAIGGDCTAFGSKQIIVNPIPTVTLTATPNLICEGDETILEIKGNGVSYSWNYFSSHEATVKDDPSITTTYTVTVTDVKNCTNSASVVVTVNPKPTVTITSNPANAIICPGITATLTATSSPSYQYIWTPGAQTTAFITVSPSITTTYGVQVTDDKSCHNFTTLVLTVTAPDLTASATTTYICKPGTPVTLTATSTATSPSYLWKYNSSTKTTASFTDIPNATTTYYVTLTDNRGCTASTSIIVQVNFGKCLCNDYCPRTLSGTITGSFAAGSYCVNSDITISGNATFINSEFKMAQGVQINVAQDANFKIIGSHLYSCDDFLWKGISAPTKAKVSILESPAIPALGIASRSSLIEDAETAIDIGSGDLKDSRCELTVNGAIFNKNHAAIKLSQISRTNLGGISLPVSITNSVFTCRSLFYKAGTTVSPSYTWLSVTTLKQATGSDDQLRSPYRMGNGLYPPTQLKSSEVPSNRTPLAGILVIDINEDTGNPFTSFDIIIGNEAQNAFNIFDNLSMGIYIQDASVISRNNVFQNTIPFLDPKNGVKFKPAGIAEDLGLGNKRLVVTSSSPTLYQNKFYDCHAAITNAKHGQSTAFPRDIGNYTIENCTMRSSQNFANYETAHQGENGVFLYRIDFVYTNTNITTTITGNTIYNIENAIHIINNQIFSSPVSITNNTIRRKPETLILNPNELPYVKKAITVEGSNLIYNYDAGASLDITGNTFAEVYNGIHVRNYVECPITVINNTIGLSNNFAAPNNDQYGIQMENNLNERGYTSSIIHNNSIANTIGINLLTGYSINSRMRGIYISKGSTKQVSCNTISRTYKGIEFEEKQLQATIINNTMQNHHFGFVLNTNAQVGTPNPAVPNGISIGQNQNPADNRWEGLWNGSQTTGVGDFKTALLNGASAYNSIMFIRNNMLRPTNPNGSSTTGPGLTDPGKGYIINGNTGSLRVGSSAVLINDPCNPIEPPKVPAPIRPNLPILERLALGKILNAYFPNEARFIDMQLLYNLLIHNNALTSSSAILQDFVNTCQNRCIGQLYNINQALADGNYTQAQALSNGLDLQHPTEAAYQVYYNNYIKLQLAIDLTNDDNKALLQLANACPFTDGPAVYLARSLYNAANASNLEFVNNCPAYHPPTRKGNEANAELKHGTESSIFDVLMYPNPNIDGVVQFASIGYANATLDIIVTDIAGKLVYKGNKQTENGNTSIELNVNSGIYSVKITNTHTNESLIKKLVITK